MADDIERWLKELDLEKYVDVFIAHEVGLRDLPHISENDLKELGLPLGPRKRVLGGIQLLRNEAADKGGAGALRAASQVERRQLTVMLCDLVGSTELSQQLDAEDLREVMGGYQNAVVNAITPYGGHIGRFLGDGVLVYFGWPQAYEDQAERAVRAGLDIVSAVEQLQPVKREKLQVRVGIATGQVVIGEPVRETVRETEDISGETPNLAARLQQLAAPGQVIIGAVTRRLLGEVFELEDLGAHRLKGFSEPVPAWWVRRKAAVTSRFDAARGGALTQFVGRRHETELLLDRWQKARRGEGQVVLLSGEAGFGKSRLVRYVYDQIAAQPHDRTLYQCSPFHINSALNPIIQQLEQAASFDPDDALERKLDKLEAFLRTGPDGTPETRSLLAALLSLPFETRYGALNLAPSEQKDRTLAAIVEQLLLRAERQPVFLLFEDAHWSDPTSRELLDAIFAQIHDKPVLIIVTYRPSFEPPWEGYDHLTKLSLDRLGQEESEELVDAVMEGNSLPVELIEQVLERTDGVPLFVEGFLKTIVESKIVSQEDGRFVLTGPLPSLTIPSTLQDSFVARLDNLSPVKEIAQIAACIGRRFSFSMLLEVSGKNAPVLENALGVLEDAELIFSYGAPAEGRYTFKHALIQDAAYQSLLRGTRQEYHLRIARAFKSGPSGEAISRPELLAHHFAEAHQFLEASHHWCLAAERAIERSENLEAINHVAKGLEALESLDPGPERARFELELQTIKGAALRTTRGYAASETRDAYERGRILCDALEDPPQLFPVLWGLMLNHMVRAEVEVAYDLATQLFDLSRRRQDPDLILEAQIAIGLTQFHRGDVSAAREHLEAGIDLYDPRQHRHHVLAYGQDPGVLCLSYSAWALWFLGYPDQALARIERALDVAEQTSHPFSRVLALTFAARIRRCRGEIPEQIAIAEEIIATSKQHRFAYYLSQGTFERGCAHILEGDAERGIVQLQEGLKGLRATETDLGRPGSLIQLAEAYADAGLHDKAQAALSEAASLVDGKGTRFWDAEICRLNGVILLAVSADNAGEAEACFREALAHAGKQKARSFELRAAIDLSRLLDRRGDRPEARAILKTPYDWFTQGDSTQDLRQAKEMLGSMG